MILGHNMNTLYYGDNLDVLRENIKSESVDLVYLDPPFNSARGYNVLFREHDVESEAQIRAFEDTWIWDTRAERTWKELTDPSAEERGVPAKLVTLMESLRPFLGQNDMLAYLTMMAIRLVELRRVLKPEGSLYLHCDPTASHYLKLVLDAVFGHENFRNEIIWRRTRAHNDLKLIRYGAIHDTIFFYSRGDKWLFNPQYGERDENASKTHDQYVHTDGKLYRKGDCRAPGGRGPSYKWNGHTHNWRFSPEERDRLIAEGRIVYSRTGMPRVLRLLDPTKGSPLQDIWTDIDPPNSGSGENLRYPTQKPVTLLERIITASSNEGDTILDPFCGCGTTIHAAQRLKRDWLGIDVTHLAIALIRNRLDTAFPGIKYEVRGEPADENGAHALADADPYQFQWWALHLIGARPVGGGSEGASRREGKKGKDRGIDGVIRFKDDPRAEKSHRIIVSVKAGKNIGPSMVRDLVGTIDGEGAQIGVFLSMGEPTSEMRAVAVKAGTWHSETWGREYPRVQLITVAEAFAGKRVEYPGQDVTLQPAPTDRRKVEALSLPGVDVPPVSGGASKKRRK